jgi:hypothetical protein
MNAIDQVTQSIRDFGLDPGDFSTADTADLLLAAGELLDFIGIGDPTRDERLLADHYLARINAVIASRDPNEAA